MVLWRPKRPSRTNTQKICFFHYRGRECKRRKSRNTWSKRQIWPWSTEWNRAKTNWLLPREHTGHSKHLLPTTLRRPYTWTSPDGQHWNQCLYSLQPKMEKLYTVSKNQSQNIKYNLGLSQKKSRKSWRAHCSVQFSRSVVSDSLRPHE